MRRRIGAVVVAGRRFLRVRAIAPVFAAGLVLFVVAACSSSQNGSLESGESTGVRVVYHATYTDADPSEQTITFLSDGGRRFRVTFDPPGYEDFIVSDGVKTVESIEGTPEYISGDQTGIGWQDFFRVRAGDLQRVCPGAKLVGQTTVLGRAADRYTCDPADDESAEITIDSDSGILLDVKSDSLTIVATSIDMNAAIPAGSFDLPTVPTVTSDVTAPPTPDSKSPGVLDAQNAATAIEKCRADAHGVLPPPIRAAKGPKVILHCGGRTETFAVTPGNSVEYQPQDDFYELVVTLPDGSMIFAMSDCPGEPADLCIKQSK